MNGFAKNLVKLAFELEELRDVTKDQALRAVDKALPYAASGTAGGLGGLWLGHSVNKLRPDLPAEVKALEKGFLHSRAGLPLVLAAVGAGIGVGTEKLRHMAREAKYKNLLKETRLENP